MQENTMAQTSTRRVARQVSGGVLTAALLAACGGGEIFAILQIVTPLAGQWDAGGGETIAFTAPTEDEQVFLSQLSVTANVGSVSGVCGASLDVPGTLDNGKLSLRLPGATAACLEGSFVDLRRFDAVAIGAQPARSYFNSRVDVRLQTGVWVSDNGQLTLKFEGPSSVDNNSSDLNNATGCDLSNTASKVRFSGTMTGFNTTTLARPTIAELRNTVDTALMFRQVEFVDGATLKLLNATGQSLTLTRKPDPLGIPGTPCS